MTVLDPPYPTVTKTNPRTSETLVKNTIYLVTSEGNEQVEFLWGTSGYQGHDAQNNLPYCV